MSTIGDANTEQLHELKLAIQDVATRARRDGRYLDVGVCEAVVALFEGQRQVMPDLEEVPAKPKRGRPKANGAAGVPNSVADLGGGK